ncbi:MAG: hypothetical protein QMD61_05760 [Methanobacterium sp.]|nr:hypothetical protein [Methanobacterium sp.]
MSFDNSRSKPNNKPVGFNDTTKNNMTPPSDVGNRKMFNRSGSLPSGNFIPPNGNRTPENVFNGNMPSNAGGNGMKQDYSGYGTLIYSGNYVKVYKIS